MLRPAVPADLVRLVAIRDGSGADALSDPTRIEEGALAALIRSGAVTVWEDGARVEGFAATDSGCGKIVGLLVTSAARGKGGGRALLAAACDTLRRAGHRAAALTVVAGGDAERHYRAAGWVPSEPGPAGRLVLKKPL